MHWYLRKIKDFILYDFKWIFKNLWIFRKELITHRNWDYTYSLSIFRRSLEELCKNIEKNGHEIDSSRFKKVNKMKRAIQIIKWHEKDSFMELAEKDLGYEYIFKGFVNNKSSYTDEERRKNSKITEKSLEIERETWKELFEILKGQDYTNFDKNIDWYEQHDGSGLQGWWD